jgi:hypothetical protein
MPLIALSADQRVMRQVLSGSKLGKMLEHLHTYKSRLIVRHVVDHADEMQTKEIGVDPISRCDA